MQGMKEAVEARAKYLKLGTYNQQLYQVLASG